MWTTYHLPGLVVRADERLGVVVLLVEEVLGVDDVVDGAVGVGVVVLDGERLGAGGLDVAGLDGVGVALVGIGVERLGVDRAERIGAEVAVDGVGAGLGGVVGEDQALGRVVVVDSVSALGASVMWLVTRRTG